MSSRNHLRNESSPFSALAAVELSCRNGISLPIQSQHNRHKEININIRWLVGVSQLRLLKGPVRTISQLPVVRRYIVNNNNLHRCFLMSHLSSYFDFIFSLFFNHKTLSRSKYRPIDPRFTQTNAYCWQLLYTNACVWFHTCTHIWLDPFEMKHYRLYVSRVAVCSAAKSSWRKWRVSAMT